ncbi:MAG TPA: LysE family transporter, partial [Ramlibacter sp.]|nr:LysE family transporter [Ramlibacter sp.]
MITPEFLITSLIVVLVPGTGVIYTVSTALAQGRVASFFAALGCTAGIVPHLLATVLGLAAVLHASAMAFQVLRYAGVAYLFYVAWATWRDQSAFTVDGAVT